MKSVLCVLLLLAAATPLAAQVSVEVHVVEVPVTVVDREGNPVRGLTAANFQLFDDGKAQSITAFDNIDFSSKADVGALSPLNPHARRSFMLLFDLGYSDVKSLARAREAATQFVKNSVQPRDLVSVGSIDPEKGFLLHTAFTTDRNVVTAAIAQPATYFGNDPLQLSDLDAFGQSVSGVGGGDLAPSDTASTGNAAAADAHLAEIKEMTARNNRDFAAGRVIKEIQSFDLLASTLRSVPGRKQIVLLSTGFDPSLVRGRRHNMGADLADMAKATSGHAYLIDNEARFGNTASQTVLEDMVKSFKQSDVVMNAIDIGGVRTLEQGATKGGIANEGLHLLADPTGGKVFENTNNLGADLDHMMRQQEVVYVLAFHAAASKPGKLHNLSVKLVNGPPGAAVNSRIAWYEGSGEKPMERKLTNAEIIVNDIPQSGLRVAALAAAVPGGPKAPVPLFIEINGDDLLRGAAKPVPVDIFVYAFDDGGVVRDRIYQRITVDPAHASEKVKQAGIKYFTTLALPPGRYALKSLVSLPETDRRGFVRTDLVVGRAGDMAVFPPLFFDKPGQWAIVKGIEHGAAPAYPFLLDGEPFTPSAAPRLAKTAEGEFALFLYNVDPAEMMMQATVTDAAGTTRPAQPSLVRQIKGDGVTKLVFHVDSSGVAAGPARLDVVLHKRGSEDLRKASVPLIVN
ncbi:MAG TPA: VWA domain-containing protein [Thermoanaerobaculia bacterium]|nr:VWA domain-containing protein [Thermoanaerobaculia bacterium]